MRKNRNYRFEILLTLLMVVEDVPVMLLDLIKLQNAKLMF